MYFMLTLVQPVTSSECQHGNSFSMAFLYTSLFTIKGSKQIQNKRRKLNWLQFIQFIYSWI